MSIESDIIAALAADSTFNGLIGTRVYLDWAPQETDAPYVVFFAVANNPVVSLAGDSGQDNPLWQFSCWAGTPDAANAVAAALVGAMAAATTAGTAFRAVRRNGPYYGPVEPEVRLFHRIVEFSTWQ